MGIDITAKARDGVDPLSPGKIPGHPNLDDGGTIGHAGAGGRPKKLTAEDLANEAGEYSEDYQRLHRTWLDQAFLHLESGETRLADMASKRAESIQEINVRYGVGTKSRIELSNAGVLDVCRKAYEDSSDLPTFLKALQAGLGWKD